MSKPHFKGWKTPRLSCPRFDCRVRQKPDQLDMFWDSPDRGGFNYDIKQGRMCYERSSQDESRLQPKAIQSSCSVDSSHECA